MSDDETIELFEVWAPDGRHYFRLPDGREVDIPKVDTRPIGPNDYIFHDGQWTTSAKP